MKAYVAAPIFSPAERSFAEAIADAVAGTCDVHLPHRNGPLVESALAAGMTHSAALRAAYESDVRAIRECDVVVAFLEGRALDEGVCIEMGFAKALGKEIFAIKSDVRSAFPWGHNAMVEGCVDRWFRSVDELKLALSSRQWSLRGSALR